MPNQEASFLEGVPAIEADGLAVRFPVRGGVLGKVKDYFTAVDGVSFTLSQGKILSVVGESGCGKSTLVKSLVGLVPLASGSVKLFGREVHEGKVAMDGGKAMRVCDLVQMVFQDPFSSLNPRQTVSEILTAPLMARKVSFEQAQRRACELLERVSIPVGAMEKFPHEFSGGQRQRLCIARSLMVSPKILLCDEVTSALDVSVQAQILHLLDDLRRDLGLSILFISHDMQVVRAISDDVLVMYFGKVVERGVADEVLTNPQHDYTKKLLSCVPTIRN
ncbi:MULTISPECIES: ATP-binding cassette domain-containing protein [unclassified Fibrobacter]|uniref:ATP-binding cassette domain-containing protein n=1 Tax=unclassified Fibrobacter TaxID=2634177 RepID=UPI0015646047|nr:MULTISPECIES: ATP-binding cassette domain-containing protein [unclassified Fibrobacter]